MNGQTERMNQEVEKYLRLYINYKQDNWFHHLLMAEFAINNRINTQINKAPFEVIYGYRPEFDIPIGRRQMISGIEERIEELKEARREVGAALFWSKKLIKEGFEKGKGKDLVFKEGDYVWLDAGDICLKLPSTKLGDRQLGPYEVLEKVGDLDYRLDLPLSLAQVHPVFHVSKLSPFKGNEINGLIPEEQEPVELEGEDEPEYEVENILDCRIRWRRPEYLVKWKGYDDGHNSWEPKANLVHAKRLLNTYHKRYPEKKI